MAQGSYSPGAKGSYQMPKYQMGQDGKLVQVSQAVGGNPLPMAPVAAASGPMAAVDKYMPEFSSILTKDGTLGDQFKVQGPQAIRAGKLNAGQLDIGGLSANQDALNALKSRAMSQGQSPWLKMQLDKLNLDEMTARDRAAGQALQGSAQANAALAMRGGLQSGARERIAAGGARDLNAMRQGIGRDMAANRLGLGIADDQTKMSMLSQIPGMDIAMANQRADLNKFNIGTRMDADKTNIANQLGVDQFNSQGAYDANKFNVANTIGGVGNYNAFKLGRYGEQMKAYGADQQSKAIGNNPGSSGLLGGLLSPIFGGG